jgi:hypothetical protein
VNPEDYGIHLTKPSERLHWLPPDELAVEVTDLVATLEDAWDNLFVDSNQPLRESGYGRCRAKPLTAACHPLSVPLRDNILETLRRLDGVEMTARELEAELNRSFSCSDIQPELRRLQNLGEYPRGFHIYQAQLNENILLRFVGADGRQGRSGYGVTGRPPGWVDRRGYRALHVD